MKSYDITLLTESRYVSPANPNQYVRNLLKEDRLVKEALEAKGLKVCRKDWADEEFDWSKTRNILFRTNWDYFDRYEEFTEWLQSVSLKTNFINSIELVSWNSDKHYLADLSKKGIRIISTRYLPLNSHLDIEELKNLTGWENMVIKPTVGGAGRHTYKITPKNIGEMSMKLAPLMKREDFMIQPFQYSVAEVGEVSMMIFGNEFSHAVLKKAKPGDFRVQDDHGGTVHHYEPTQEEIEFALSAVEACPSLPAYARVDIIRDNDGVLAVSELEIIEPELWFRFKPEAAPLLADQVLKSINNNS
ncbi:RimK family alpha-L-glutamate ligase [Gracilimonas sp.]|uniref:ATP-grasp domain-containing protein n=1 Tax=Gracilimonas sp. TaxID=1974203 RepID=UPI002871191C|nr:hypothetical protein [Gracilimonas sp.]